MLAVEEFKIGSNEGEAVMGYGRGYSRRGYSRPQTVGAVRKANARPGTCRVCKVEVPAGCGQLYREADGSWSVMHLPREWVGSPVSGQYTYGCPDETDRMNREGHFGKEGGALSEHDRIASAAAFHAASAPPARPARRYAYSGSYERCTHEDYPCCGCGE